MSKKKLLKEYTMKFISNESTPSLKTHIILDMI